MNFRAGLNEILNFCAIRRIFLLIKQFYLRFDGKKLISIPISGNGNNFRDDAFLFFLLQS